MRTCDGMKSVILLAALVGASVAAPKLCNIFSPGHWVSSQAVGMSDFAYGGVAPNLQYFCIDGCLATQAFVSDMRVAVNSTNAPRVRMNKNADRLKQIRDGDDPNAFGCVDDALRAKITAALGKVTSNTAKGILQALQYNLGLTGWAMVVADFNFEASEIIQDVNYCDFDTAIGVKYWSLLLAKIDMS